MCLSALVEGILHLRSYQRVPGGYQGTSGSRCAVQCWRSVVQVLRIMTLSRKYPGGKMTITQPHLAFLCKLNVQLSEENLVLHQCWMLKQVAPVSPGFPVHTFVSHLLQTNLNKHITLTRPHFPRTVSVLLCQSSRLPLDMLKHWEKRPCLCNQVQQRTRLAHP